jgi:hypothetical protein
MKGVLTLQRIALCLNTDDPYQKELFDFVSLLPNGKKRNASAFLKMLVDREYQKNKEQYLHEKKTQEASSVKVIKSKGSIKFDLTKDINQNSD